MDTIEQAQVNKLIKITNFLTKKVNCILKSTQNLLLLIILALYNA